MSSNSNNNGRSKSNDDKAASRKRKHDNTHPVSKYAGNQFSDDACTDDFEGSFSDVEREYLEQQGEAGSESPITWPNSPADDSEDSFGGDAGFDEFEFDELERFNAQQRTKPLPAGSGRSLVRFECTSPQKVPNNKIIKNETEG